MSQKNNEGIKLKMDYFIFEDHSLSKGGKLPDVDRRPHACWYYLICAHQNLESAAEGATYEGELDITPALNNIARSVATQYNLDSPDDFLKFMSVCVAEADRIGRTWDPRVMKPWLEPFKHKI